MLKEQVQQVEDKMQKTISVLGDDLDTIRTGRANPKMLDKILVDYYGTMTPIKQMAQITVPEPRTLQIQPWDKSALKLIDKAIQLANLGLNPNNDGTNIRINIPQLTDERRGELCKQAQKLGEAAKIAVRNIRRDANDSIKKAEKKDSLPEDEVKTTLDEIQKLTDNAIKDIDKKIEAKEKDIKEI